MVFFQWKHAVLAMPEADFLSGRQVGLHLTGGFTKENGLFFSNKSGDFMGFHGFNQEKVMV
jgi:hypothetical protein